MQVGGQSKQIENIRWRGGARRQVFVALSCWRVVGLCEAGTQKGTDSLTVAVRLCGACAAVH